MWLKKRRMWRSPIRPEVRTGAVVADEGEGVVLDERVQVLPVLEVVGTQQEVGAHRFSRRPLRLGPGRQRVVGAPLLPDAGVEHPVRQLGAVRGPHRDHRFVGHLLPVEQQRDRSTRRPCCRPAYRGRWRRRGPPRPGWPPRSTSPPGRGRCSRAGRASGRGRRKRRGPSGWRVSSGG